MVAAETAKGIAFAPLSGFFRTSDGWVRGEAEGTGAVVVPAATLLEVLRR